MAKTDPDSLRGQLISCVGPAYEERFNDHDDNNVNNNNNNNNGVEDER